MNKSCWVHIVIIGLAFLWSCSSREYATEDYESKEDQVYIEGLEKEYSAAEEYSEVKEEALEEETGAMGLEVYEQLSDNKMFVLEERGIEKVKDFWDYVTILSNEDYDEELRQNAMKMALDLFENEASFIVPSLNLQKDKVTVKHFLNNVFNESVSIIDVELEDVGMNREVNEQIISCSIRVNEEKIVLWFPVNFRYEVKKFGETSQEVWKVYLGDVNQF